MKMRLRVLYWTLAAILVALVVLLFVAPPAKAESCVPGGYHAVVGDRAPVYPSNVEVVAERVLLVPQYSTYNTGPSPEMLMIMQLLQQLSKRVDSVEQRQAQPPLPPVLPPGPGQQPLPPVLPPVPPGPQPPPMPTTDDQQTAPPEGNLAATVKTYCAACHTQGRLAGTNFAFLDPSGRLLRVDAEHLRFMVKKVKGKTMPPPNNKKGIPPLTQDAFDSMLDGLEDL